jgi:hypothetical protein
VNPDWEVFGCKRRRCVVCGDIRALRDCCLRLSTTGRQKDALNRAIHALMQQHAHHPPTNGVSDA